MSSRIFQNVIIQMKDAVDRTIGVVDEQGFVVASSELAMIGSRLDDFHAYDFESGEQSVVTGSRTYSPLSSANGKFDYAAFVEGSDALARTICSVAAVAFNEAKSNYEEKHNKAAFVKNIISDNILPGDVYVRAKELHFVTDEPRCVLLVRQMENPDVAAVEVIQRLFPDKQKDFVLNINESDVVVVKSLPSANCPEEILRVARSIENLLQEELGVKCVIGISTNARHLRELADRYKEAQVAIEVGRVFESEKNIINYESLGLGRIIYQLPTTLCEMFLNEVFKKNPIETLDEDTLETINKFFENNLNVSETSRKLYVHRNTLVYRLEKIKKITGLDLREFDHAIVFKVAMMVKMYLDSLNTSKY
ncbi:MAG: CdaR family transcriptional regulator [Clostridia bacterium]|nr:PucR family transcriptional regulator [Oscillospiraceae bacterium]PWM14500.1 MAG: CdaR family transcriptional regulator [Clostridia bacterium]